VNAIKSYNDVVKALLQPADRPDVLKGRRAMHERSWLGAQKETEWRRPRC
jgi:hypothetical protein